MNRPNRKGNKTPKAQRKGAAPDWDSEKAKEMQKKSTQAHYDRKAARESEFEAYKNLSINERIQKAFNEHDNVMLDMCLKFSAHVGADFKSSSEYVQRQNVTNDVNVKRNVVINFRQATQEDAK